MTNGFGDYPEITDADSPCVDATSQPKQKKRRGKHKALKALTKALKKHNKLLKKEQQQRDTEQQQQEDGIKKNNCRNVKGFLVKLGDAICKAVPAILTAFATAAIGCLFNRRPYIKNFQAG